MSTDLTPEAARAAAAWLDGYDRWPVPTSALRAEADRLEAASRTPGQVALESWFNAPTTNTMDRRMDCIAAAVVAHHVGPDRVVVDRADLSKGVELLLLDRHAGLPSVDALREALS